MEFSYPRNLLPPSPTGPPDRDSKILLVITVGRMGRRFLRGTQTRMTAHQYDILKKDAAALVWVEAVQDLETAKLRIKQLASGTDAEYVVFDQRTRKVVIDLRLSAGPLERC